MTALTTTPAPVAEASIGAATTHRAIPLRRIISTELRKMFDNSVRVLADGEHRHPGDCRHHRGHRVLLRCRHDLQRVRDRDRVSHDSGVLPIIAILSVTSEWSQRSGLTTFTLVPHRDRVIAAKAITCVSVAIATIPFAFAVGAHGNIVGTTIAGINPVWDVTATNMATIALANVLGLLVGFMLGVVIRSSAGAIVAYFVYSFVLPALSVLLAGSQAWFRAPARPGRGCPTPQPKEPSSWHYRQPTAQQSTTDLSADG